MNIAFVSSKGGHLGQIGLIFTKEVIGENNAILITESSDSLLTKEKYFNEKYRTYFFRKDYLGINAFRYLATLFKIIKIFRKEKIQVVITNGAQISIPAIMACKILRVKSIFIDTIVRVKTPNWSARACYLLTDRFIVQHKSMMKRYGKKSEYWGSII